jgi:LacI family transcriptional regulator
MALVTLKDVAERAGYSLSTVAFILRGHPKPFPEETRARVLVAARELGYRPNASARAVRSGRMGAYALVQVAEPNHGDLAWDTVDGILGELDRDGMHLIWSRMSAAQLANPSILPKALEQLVADGLLMSYHTEIVPGVAEGLQRLGMPTVWINTRRPADSVGLDDEGAGAAAVRELRRLGHRRIAYVNTWRIAVPLDRIHASIRERRDGYLAAMAGLGLEPQLIGAFAGADPTLDDARSILSQRHRPTALIAYDRSMLTPFLMAAAALGLRIPRDLSLVTFDHQVGKVCDLELATFVGPYREMGMRAVQMLRTAILKRRPQKPATLPFAWHPGQTSAPPA